MGSKLNRHAYEGLIEEDVARVMKEMPDSLEREHVIQVLRHSVECYYPTSAEGPGTQAGQPGAGPDTPPTYVHAGQWIPVTERLPKAVYAGDPPRQSEDVLVLYNEGGDEPRQSVACYWHDDNEWATDNTSFEFATVTHWMPLPDRPQTISLPRP